MAAHAPHRTKRGASPPAGQSFTIASTKAVVVAGVREAADRASRSRDEAHLRVAAVPLLTDALCRGPADHPAALVHAIRRPMLPTLRRAAYLCRSWFGWCELGPHVSFKGKFSHEARQSPITPTQRVCRKQTDFHHSLQAQRGTPQAAICIAKCITRPRKSACIEREEWPA